MPKRKVAIDIDSLGNRIDNLAVRVFGEADVKLNPRMEARDRRILKNFPTFVGICVFIWIISILYQDDYSLGMLIQLLCLVFCTMFALLGIPCLFLMDEGPLPRSFVVTYGLVGSAIIWIFMAATDQTLFDQAVKGVLEIFGISISGYVLHFVSYIVIFMILTCTTCAVLSVVCAYLRNYVVNVLMAINSRVGTSRRGRAEKFFLVPDIIDITSVELEPRFNQHRIDINCFLSLCVYMMFMGVVISSYVFVNHYFLDAVNWKIMLAIMILLSSFMPCLIIPWQFFRSIGAKVCSAGNRDYYIWNGAKSRLFSSFLALSSFSMMFLLSLYFGHDILTILMNYALYLLPLLVISVMYALMFSNNFSGHLVKSVYVRFYEERMQAQIRSEPRLLPLKDKEE